MLVAGAKLIQLKARGGGFVSLDPSRVRAVVAAEGGGCLIWFGHGHEIIVEGDFETVSRKLREAAIPDPDGQ